MEQYKFDDHQLDAHHFNINSEQICKTTHNRFSGLAGTILSRKLLLDKMGDVSFVLLFTESLRSPDIEDLTSYDKILPPKFCSPTRQAKISRFISADKLKDNIYV